MANWGRSKGTAGDKPNFKFLDPANIAGSTADDGKDEGAQHVGWVNGVDTGSGAVTSITVTNGGTGHSVGDPVTIDGAGVGATAEVATVDEGVIETVTVTNGGAGYVQGTTTATAGDAVLAPVVTNRVKRETIVAFGSMTA